MFFHWLLIVCGGLFILLLMRISEFISELEILKISCAKMVSVNEVMGLIRSEHSASSTEKGT